MMNNPATPTLRTWLSTTLTAIRRAGWAPGIVFTAHVLALKTTSIYSLWPSLDIPMHLAGGLAIAWFFSALLETLCRAELVQEPDPLIKPVLVFALVCVAAVFWEFAEYAAAWIRGLHTRMGLEDTMLDMGLGILGGSLIVGMRVARDGALAHSPDARSV